jgi:GNAT superfamily N-acetyltransferase
MPSQRNLLTEGSWTLSKLESNTICASFDCGEADLNEYFQIDVTRHREQLLTQTYCLTNVDSSDLPLALLDFCNDGVHIESYRGKVDVSPLKGYHHLPAVKLTRLGVRADMQGKNIGTKALNMAKKFFVTDNRTGCRLLIVDAYNNSRVLNFYMKNDFQLLIEKDKDKKKPTRLMYFDLKRMVVV